MRILVVDDSARVRMSLLVMLELMEEVQVVGEAKNGKEAVMMMQQLNPDVILMDLIMPEMDGAEATSIIHLQNPKIQIILLTTSVDLDLIPTAMQSGATAYLPKVGKIDDIMAVIRSVF